MRFQRELTAAVLIPAVLAVLVAAPAWAWAVLVALAATAALVEFYRLIEASGWIVPKPAGIGLFLAFVAGAYLASLLALLLIAGVTLLALPTLVMFASPREAVWLASSASSVFATLYVALGAGAMVGLRAIGWQPVVFLLAIVWAGDSAAYYVGRRRSCSFPPPPARRALCSWARSSASSSPSWRSSATSSSPRSSAAAR